MKKCMLLILCLLLFVSLHAREKTLATGSFDNGGYGGPVWKVGLVNGELGMFTGGRGGWIINHTFAVGGGGYGLITRVDTDLQSTGSNDLFLDLEYGGFEMEYIHNSDEIFHWTVHATLGGGTIRLMEHNPNEAIDSDAIYIFEPSLNLDINIFTWFRLGLGASYRLALDVNLMGIDEADISGPSGGIIFKFGSF